MKVKINGLLRNSLIGGLICGVISALLSYTILPFPKSLTDHVIGTSIGGFFAVLLHIIVHTLKSKTEIEN
ncbi:MAG: hypothetical protein JW864_04870 [Spirochaetes bacterium]|nr:hypothetical protein [Spirochaetota bacterium]